MEETEETYESKKQWSDAGSCRTHFVGAAGGVALGTDVAVFYYNWVQLQKAADSALLGGANYLPDNPTQAKTTANTLAQSNNVKASEIVSTVGVNNSSISIKLERTVPYLFARALGLATAVSRTGQRGQRCCIIQGTLRWW